MRVKEDVKVFRGVALGVYHFFRDEAVNVTSGIVVPEGIVGNIDTALTIFLNGLGSIMHVVNTHGAATTPEGEEGAHTAYYCHGMPPPPPPTPPTPPPPGMCFPGTDCDNGQACPNCASPPCTCPKQQQQRYLL